MSNPNLWPLWCGMALSLVAAGINWKTFKVPNWLTLGSAGGGLVVGLLSTVTVLPLAGGIFSALGAGLLGFVLFAPAYVTGRLGAANVKMQMAFGIWVGCAFSAGTAALLVLAGTFVGSILGNIQKAMKKKAVKHQAAQSPAQPADKAEGKAKPQASTVDPKQALLAVQMPLTIGSILAVLIPLALGWV